MLLVTYLLGLLTFAQGKKTNKLHKKKREAYIKGNFYEVLAKDGTVS
jgi:hypothetical protein